VGAVMAAGPGAAVPTAAATDRFDGLIRPFHRPGGKTRIAGPDGLAKSIASSMMVDCSSNRAGSRRPPAPGGRPRRRRGGNRGNLESSQPFGDRACGEVTGPFRRVDPGSRSTLPQAVRAQRPSERDAAQGVLREAQRAPSPRRTQEAPQGPSSRPSLSRPEHSTRPIATRKPGTPSSSHPDREETIQRGGPFPLRWFLLYDDAWSLGWSVRTTSVGEGLRCEA
jgi:hypothetical protein